MCPTFSLIGGYVVVTFPSSYSFPILWQSPSTPEQIEYYLRQSSMTRRIFNDDVIDLKTLFFNLISIYLIVDLLETFDVTLNHNTWTESRKNLDHFLPISPKKWMRKRNSVFKNLNPLPRLLGINWLIDFRSEHRFESNTNFFYKYIF